MLLARGGGRSLYDLAKALSPYYKTSRTLLASSQRMGFSLWSLFKAGLLVSNAVTVLNPKRFLARYNLTPADMSESPLKNQVIGLLQATQYLKVPLIILNILVVIVELLFG